MKENQNQLDLSSAQVDGPQTPVKRGGGAISCQQTGKREPSGGRPNDVFQIEQHFRELLEMLHDANIRTDGLFLNADAGFDTKKLSALCCKQAMIPNFCLNPRNGSVADRDDYFDRLLYKHRVVFEHAFAWTVAA